MKRSFYIAIFTFLTIPRIVLSQGTVSGSVVDRQTGDPLIGATIFLEGSNYGTICDFDGQFQLFDVEAGTYILATSMIGYQKTAIIGVEAKYTTVKSARHHGPL